MLTIIPTVVFSLATIRSALALTATSWGKERLDVFGLYPSEYGSPEYWHKYYTSEGGWQPYDNHLEHLAGPPTNVEAYYKDVSSVSWGPHHLDFFATVEGKLSHVYWSSGDSEWKGWDYLPDDDSNSSLRGAPATASWGSGRIDVVSRDKDGKYLHLYFNHDEHRWTGWEDPWNSPSKFETDPIIIAPDKDHFDVFGRLSNGTIVHLYWNGKEYSKWDHLDWRVPEIGWKQGSSLTATTWKNGSWDLWALDAHGSLWHTFWRGAPVNEFFPWENLSDDHIFEETPKVVHWSAGHTDIVGLSGNSYFHRYWDAGRWTNWKDIGSHFYSQPEVVSWGEGHWAVFGIDVGFLWVAMYVDGKWRDWEMLATVTEAALQRGQRDQQAGSDQQVVLEGYKQGL